MFNQLIFLFILLVCISFTYIRNHKCLILTWQAFPHEQLLWRNQPFIIYTPAIKRSVSVRMGIRQQKEPKKNITTNHT